MYSGRLYPNTCNIQNRQDFSHVFLTDRLYCAIEIRLEIVGKRARSPYMEATACPASETWQRSSVDQKHKRCLGRMLSEALKVIFSTYTCVPLTT